MTDTLDTFTEAVLRAQEHIAAGLPDPFNADAAVVFLLDADGRMHELSRYEDLYSGLAEVSAYTLQPHHVAIGVMTTGWASPFEGEPPPDQPPSEHPARQRVQICTAVDRNFRVVTVLKLADCLDPVFDEMGEGPLADAMSTTLVMMLRRAARRSVDA